ncbi:MAG: 4Fe-4S binding protein, partial [Clostridia bacterium]|nr:4Fe-4S binding protein [Clostridia bacterium]
MTIKDICDIETKCTGCSACAAACPTGAIRMTENQ